MVSRGTPPPPPNVGDIKLPPRRTRLRKTSAARRQTGEAPAPRPGSIAAACHRKIDPLGLAFDNYDAIGRWRTEEAVRDGAGANPKIDASGELPDGRTFADAAGLKKLMVADLDKFADAFGEKLATYALRAARMTFADHAELETHRRASESGRLSASGLLCRITRYRATCSRDVEYHLTSGAELKTYEQLFILAP